MCMICLHLMCSSVCSWYIQGGSRTVATEENCPPPSNLNLALKLTLTLTERGNFLRGKLSGYHSKNGLTYFSTWENFLPWDFDYNSIQNANILGGPLENSLTSETHSELCETCMMERFCKNSEQLKRAIYIRKRVLS